MSIKPVEPSFAAMQAATLAAQPGRMRANVPPQEAIRAATATQASTGSAEVGASDARQRTDRVDAAQRTQTEEGNLERLRKALDRAQEAIAPVSRDIVFSLNEKSGSVVVKIVDRESKEVIKQIPSEEFIRIAEVLAENIKDNRTGILVEQKA